MYKNVTNGYLNNVGRSCCRSIGVALAISTTRVAGDTAVTNSWYSPSVPAVAEIILKGSHWVDSFSSRCPAHCILQDTVLPSYFLPGCSPAPYVHATSNVWRALQIFELTIEFVKVKENYYKTSALYSMRKLFRFFNQWVVWVEKSRTFGTKYPHKMQQSCQWWLKNPSSPWRCYCRA